jgi:hypothetical protein
LRNGWPTEPDLQVLRRRHSRVGGFPARRRTGSVRARRPSPSVGPADALAGER